MTSPSPYICQQCNMVCHGIDLCSCCTAVAEIVRRYAEERRIGHRVLFDEKVAVFIFPSDADVDADSIHEIEQQLVDYTVEVHRL